ncbi:MAG: BRCT domain-containing protein, partial [Terriglobia bacterium]
PVNRAFNATRLAERTVDELLGICKGMISDGVITETETKFLVGWIEQQRAVLKVWPVKILAERIARMMEDQKIEEQERQELFELLSEISGSRSPQDVAKNLATTLPLTKPAPDIVFQEQAFCFTGKFFYGTRDACQQVVISRGGLIHKNPILDTRYLVIGTLGSTDWIHSTHGRKIEYAMELNRKGSPLALICEEHWTKYL